MDGSVFPHLPLRGPTHPGIFVAFMGFSAAVFYAVHRILSIEPAPRGYTPLVTVVRFLGGGQLIGIDGLGEYLGRAYDELKHRPNDPIKSPPTSRGAADRIPTRD